MLYSRNSNHNHMVVIMFCYLYCGLYFVVFYGFCCTYYFVVQCKSRLLSARIFPNFCLVLLEVFDFKPKITFSISLNKCLKNHSTQTKLDITSIFRCKDTILVRRIPNDEVTLLLTCDMTFGRIRTLYNNGTSSPW